MLRVAAGWTHRSGWLAVRSRAACVRPIPPHGRGRPSPSPGALPARDHAQPGTCLAGRPAGADAFARTQEVHHYRAGCPAPPDPGMPTPGTFVPDAATQRFHPGAHLRVTPGPRSVPSLAGTTPTPAGGK